MVMGDDEPDFVAVAFLAITHFPSLWVIFLPVLVLSKGAALQVFLQLLQIGVELERQSSVVIPIFIVGQPRIDVNAAATKDELGFWRSFDSVAQTPSPIIRQDGSRSGAVDVI